MSAPNNKQYYCHNCVKNVGSLVELKCPECGNDFVEEITGDAPPSPTLGGGTPQANPFFPIQNMFQSFMGGANGVPQGAPGAGGAAPRPMGPFTFQFQTTGGPVPLNNMFQQMMAQMFPGGAPGAPGAESGVPGAPGANPLQGLFANGQMNLQQLFATLGGGQPGNGSFQMGDYVVGDNIDGLLGRLFQMAQINGAPPASKEAKNSLNKFNIQAEHITKQNECPICKCDYEPNELVKEMPCGHLYHPVCLDRWLDQRNVCPMCRVEIPTADADYERQRQQRQQQQQQGDAQLSAATTTTAQTPQASASPPSPNTTNASTSTTTPSSNSNPTIEPPD